MTELNVDALISAVYKRPSIWDKKIKDHANRNVVDKAWKDISIELNIEEAPLRRKWKNLRDYFGTEYSKRPVCRSGDDADSRPTSKWQHFQQLLFLKDIVKPRECSGSLENLGTEVYFTGNQAAIMCDDSITGMQDSASTCPESPHDLDAFQTDVLERGPTCSTSAQTTASASNSTDQNPRRGETRRRRRDFHDPYQKILEIEQNKLECLSERSKQDDGNDADLLFFKSLLPYIKQIPENLKLSFRNRIQLVTEEFAFGGQMMAIQAGTSNRYDSDQYRATPTPSSCSSIASSPNSYQSYESHQY